MTQKLNERERVATKREDHRTAQGSRSFKCKRACQQVERYTGACHVKDNVEIERRKHRQNQIKQVGRM